MEHEIIDFYEAISLKAQEGISWQFHLSHLRKFCLAITKFCIINSSAKLSRTICIYLAGPGEPITALADTDVEAELPDLQVPHHVLGLILTFLHHF